MIPGKRNLGPPVVSVSLGSADQADLTEQSRVLAELFRSAHHPSHARVPTRTREAGADRTGIHTHGTPRCRAGVRSNVNDVEIACSAQASSGNSGGWSGSPNAACDPATTK